MTAIQVLNKRSETRVQMPKLLTWEEFERKYMEREDRWKYEWVRGRVEKTHRSMDTAQLLFGDNLNRFLKKLHSDDPDFESSFLLEVDAFFNGAHRRPDLSFWTHTMIRLAASGEKIRPDFVIEVISKNDQAELVAQKMEDYWAAGVEVIWQIFPKAKQVHVFHGKKMEVCMGDDLCSAEPVIAGFLMPAREIFK